MPYEDLLPPITPYNSEFWAGCRAGELRLQKCSKCGTHRFPESEVCPQCLSERYKWEAVSGRATLWSWIVMHQRYFAALADTIPYTVALVELAEGPMMMSTLRGYQGSPQCGDQLQAEFVEVIPGRWRVEFSPRTA